MTSTVTEPSTRGSADLARPRWPVLWLLAAAQLMLVLDVTVVNVALPDISAALHLDRDTIPWVMTAYTLAFGGLMLLGGRIADIVGPRRIMLIGLTIFTSSSLLCALAANAPTLLAGRATQGVGAAMFSPAALALVTATFTGPSRARALAVWGTLSAAGTALGVTIGGVLTTTFGWEWIFAINIPIGVTILLSLPFLVPAAAPGRHTAAPDQPAASPGRPAAAPGQPARSLDIPGALLVTAGTSAVIYGLVNAGSHGWTATSTLLALTAGLILWVAFALTERAVRVPLLRIGLLPERPTAAGAFLMLVATALMVGEFFIGSFDLQRAHDLSAVAVGLAFLPVGLAVGAGAHLGGRLLTRISARFVAAAGLTVAAAGQGIAAASGPAALLVTGLAVAALGTGAIFVTAFTAALASADPAVAGLRSAIVNTFHELGGAIGVAVLSTVVGAALATAAPAAGDFAPAFAVGAVIGLAAAGIALVLVPPVVRGPGQGAHH
jgi:MFS family permease